MYKVMIVDDEPIVRLALKSLVSWKNWGFEMELEASNGKQAIRMLSENPDVDIIITDINMPVMDGLELIAEINRMDMPIRKIVLSAYNDYNLVRKAFKLGISDYILKTEMDPESILALLKDVSSRPGLIGHDGKTRSNLDLNYLRYRLLKDLIDQGDAWEMEAKIKEYGLRLGRKNIVVCFLWIDDYKTVEERYDSNSLKSFVKSAVNAIYQILNQVNNGEVIYLSPQEYVVFLSYNNISESDIRGRVLEVLGMIRHSLSNYINVNISIGVSGIKDGFEHVRDLYNQSEANARLRFILGKGRSIFPEDTDFIHQEASQRIIGKEGRFLLALNEGNREKSVAELDLLLSYIGGIKSGEFEKIHAHYMEIIFIMLKSLNEKGEDTSIIFDKEIDFYEELKEFETIEEINSWIRGIAIQIANYIQGKNDTKVNRAILRAREYIKSNFKKDINLKMVSDYVGLSESHLSCIFTKMTGETFTDYLTRIRIEKARILLSKSSMKIYEICDEVGYSSVEHFSRVFKKVTGCSPNKYKNNSL